MECHAGFRRDGVHDRADAYTPPGTYSDQSPYVDADSPACPHGNTNAAPHGDANENAYPNPNSSASRRVSGFRAFVRGSRP